MPIPLLRDPQSRILRWTEPQADALDRDAANRAREGFNEFVRLHPDLAEEAWQTFGPHLGMGDAYGMAQQAFRERDRKRQAYLGLRQPTSTFEPRTQEADVVDRTGPSLSDAVFADAPAGPDERPGMTRPDLPTPRAFDEGPRGRFEMPWGNVTGRTFPQPQDVEAPPERPTEPLREAVAPSGPHPRRSPIESGRTVEKPGLSPEEIARTRPDLAQTALTYGPKVDAANLEAIGNAAAVNFARDVTSHKLTVEEAIDKYGNELPLSAAGLKIVDSLKDRFTAQEKLTKARKQEEAQAWAKEKIKRLLATGDPDDADLANALEATMHDKEFGDAYEKDRTARLEREKQRAKRAEGNKHVEVNGVLHELVPQPDGSLVARPVPGVASPRLDQLKGLDDESLLAIARTHPDPKMRADARAVYDESAAAKLKRSEQQGAGAKPTQASIETKTKRAGYLENLDRVEQAIAKHPDWIEGPKATAYAAAIDPNVPRILKRFTASALPAGYAQFYSDLTAFTAPRLNELAGSALTSGEIARYSAFLPDPYQHPDVFRANLRATREAIEFSLRYHELVEKGASHDQARAQIQAGVAQSLKRAEAAPKQPSRRPAGGRELSPQGQEYLDSIGGGG